jgi:hypothetical protein
MAQQISLQIPHLAHKSSLPVQFYCNEWKNFPPETRKSTDMHPLYLAQAGIQTGKTSPNLFIPNYPPSHQEKSAQNRNMRPAFPGYGW